MPRLPRTLVFQRTPDIMLTRLQACKPEPADLDRVQMPLRRQ